MKWKWFDASRITVQIRTRSGTFQTFSISIDSSLNFFWPLNFVRFSCRQVELVIQQNGALSSKLIWQVEPQDPPSMSVFALWFVAKLHILHEWVLISYWLRPWEVEISPSERGRGSCLSTSIMIDFIILRSIKNNFTDILMLKTKITVLQTFYNSWLAETQIMSYLSCRS